MFLPRNKHTNYIAQWQRICFPILWLLVFKFIFFIRILVTLTRILLILLYRVDFGLKWWRCVLVSPLWRCFAVVSGGGAGGATNGVDWLSCSFDQKQKNQRHRQNLNNVFFIIIIVISILDFCVADVASVFVAAIAVVIFVVALVAVNKCIDKKTSIYWYLTPQ